MERANAILSHPLFLRKLSRLRELEKDRIFCRHGMEHLLDVARIAYILCLESSCEKTGHLSKEEAAHDKELVYAAALLHDIGRARQYEDGTPHERESAGLAEIILSECGFDAPESALIIDAILSHRTSSGGEKTGFAGHLYRADKLSRCCPECTATGQCNSKTKNNRLEY